MLIREQVASGAPWETQVGYARAVRLGNVVAVSGTAPVDDEGTVVAPGDAYGQAKRCIEIVERALEQIGGTLDDVIRTRMFVTDIELWSEFGRAHSEAFGSSPPATSMVEVSRLIDPEMLIEIEADAVIPD